MYRLARVVLSVCAAVLALADAARASDFVYAAVPAAPCVSLSPCAAPHLMVIDAETAAEVVRLALPAHTIPAGIAISPDGTRVYVSNRAADPDGIASMTIVDATRHTVIGSFPTGGSAAGML